MGGGGSGVNWAAPGLSVTGRGISGQTLGGQTWPAYVTIRRGIAGGCGGGDKVGGGRGRPTRIPDPAELSPSQDFEEDILELFRRSVNHDNNGINDINNNNSNS